MVEEAATVLLKSSPVYGPIIVILGLSVWRLWKANENKSRMMVTMEKEHGGRLLKMEQDYRKEMSNLQGERMKDVLEINEKYASQAQELDTNVKVLTETVKAVSGG